MTVLRLWRAKPKRFFLCSSSEGGKAIPIATSIFAESDSRLLTVISFDLHLNDTCARRMSISAGPYTALSSRTDPAISCWLATLRRISSHRCLGVALFCSTDQLEKTAQMRVFFPEQVHRLGVHGHSRIATKAGDDRGEVEDIGRAGKPTKSRLKHDLSSKPDAAVMVRMRWKGSTEGEKDMATPDGNVSGDDFRESPSFTIVCCHFCFDPFRPDLKTAQCRMLFDAINDFHEDCGVSAPTGVTGYHPGEKHFRAGESPANLIMCGDFNSIPIMNPEFLPGPIKVKV